MRSRRRVGCRQACGENDHHQGRHCRPQRRPSIEHQAKIEIRTRGRRLGNRRAPHRGRTRHRIVLRLREKLHRAGQAILDCRKTGLDPQSHLGIPKAGIEHEQPSHDPTGCPSENAQHGQGKDDQHPPVAETDPVVEAPQDHRGRQHRRHHHAQSANGQQPHHAASQCVDSLLQGMGGHGVQENPDVLRSAIPTFSMPQQNPAKRDALSPYYAVTSGKPDSLQSRDGPVAPTVSHVGKCDNHFTTAC